MGSRTVLSGVLVSLALVTSCGQGEEDPSGAETSADASTTSEPAATASPATETPRADDRLDEQSGPYDLVLEEVAVRSREGRERIVLRFAGSGAPGWSVRYVDDPVQEGSGDPVEVGGDTVLQVDVSGTPTRPAGGDAPVRTAVGGDVVDLLAVGAYEGITRVYVGLDGDPAPYEVTALTRPTRLVLEVE